MRPRPPCVVCACVHAVAGRSCDGRARGERRRRGRGRVSARGVQERRDGRVKLVLCPQYLPKMHHSLDKIFKGLLLGGTNTKLVLLVDGNKKGQWRRTLLRRWAT